MSEQTTTANAVNQSPQLTQPQVSQENRWEQFLAEVEAGLATNPRDIKLWREKVKALVVLNRRQEILPIYDHMLEIDPGQASLWGERAQVLESLGRGAEALAGYDRALQIGGSNIDLLKAKALLLARLNRPAEAIAVYDQIFETRPDDPEFLIDKGDALLATGQIESAIAHFERAAKLAPNNFTAREWTSRGDNLLQARQLDQALKFYDRAIRADDAYPWAHRGRALVLTELPATTAQALEEISRAIELDPNNPWFYLEKGNTHNQRGEFSAAASYYREAIRLDPKYMVARLNLCIVLESMGDYTEALAAAANAIEVDPKSTDAWLHHGYCLGALDRHQEAIASYAKVLELNPDDYWANNNTGWSLSRLQRKTELEHQKDYEDSLPFYDRAIKINPQPSEPWTNKARSLAKLNRCSEALEMLNQALTVSADKAVIYGAIGQLYGDFMFQPVRALEFLRKRVELDPENKGARSDLAECLIQAGRSQEGRAEAEKLVGQMGAWVDLALSIVILASYAIEDDVAGRARQFEIVLARLADCYPQGTPAKRQETWEFGGLRNKLLCSSVSAESKFLVFTAIDLQRGDLDRQLLSFFTYTPPPKPVEHAAPAALAAPAAPVAQEPSPPAAHEE